jgi:signal transduction histidine kinase
VEFDLYYAGVFLLDETGEWAVLRAGRGKAGDALIASGYKVRVGGPSPVGEATARRAAIVSRRMDEQPPYAANPHLPDARAQVALPLVMGNTLLGALTVQSVEETAFSADDVTTLQMMADQLAIAINNTQLVKDLDVAHDELMRTKTFQVIATATGEAIHWVGNKAAPIPASVKRVTEDVVRYLVMAHALVEQAPPELRENKFAQLLADAAQEIDRRKLLEPLKNELEAQSLDRLRKTLSIESIFEDLTIIENSGRSILNIKEDLIGPARQRKLEPVSLPDLLQETVASMGIPAGVVRALYAKDLLPVRADKVQLGRVFTNLVKNAMEAMHKTEDKKLFIWARMADEPGFAVVEVNDNGSGISPDQIDKIWMAFYTTKGDRGGTGLGLPACAQIVGQLGGKIMVESEVGVGTTFSVFLPTVQEN